MRNEGILDAAERLAVKKRMEFSKKTKLEAWQRSGGICECGCGVKIISGDGPEYHHRIEDAIDGGNSLENCQVLRKRCHKSITALRRPEIDKSRRTREKNIKARSRKSRPMDGGRDSRWKAKFNGPPERRW